jgi:hypothetical protein
MKPAIYVVASLAVACSSPQPSGLPRFDNDYDGARAVAIISHAPIAVEIWAPW